MSENSAIIEELRKEALPLMEAINEWSKGATALALSMKAQGIWSPENFRKITADSVDAQAEKIDELFAELDKEN